MAPSALLPSSPEPAFVTVHAGKGTIHRPILTGALKKPTFTTIPLIDFTSLTSSSLSERKNLALSVGKAFRECGFLYAQNHGISASLQEELFGVIREFFALGTEEKMAIHVNNSDSIKGYEALLETRLDESTRGDLKEAFATGPDPHDPEQNAPSTLDLSKYPAPARGNQWPRSLPNFRKIMYQYNDALLAFSKALMRSIALSLDLEEDYFDHMAEFPITGLRALHYPPQEVEGDIGIGAHADYCWFTLVNQLTPHVSALEVLNLNGEWIPAPPIEGTLVVNVGDLLEMATGGRFVSTVHRVVNRSGEKRYSIPYFFSPSEDVVVETLPGCEKFDENGVEVGRVKVRAGEWLGQRLLRARYKHPSSIAARARGEI